MNTVSRLPRSSPLAWAMLRLIQLYRLTASLRAPRCRFVPTCSSYALQSVTTHGGLKGGWIAIRRVARCHPWNPGGLDPAPPPSEK